MTYSYVLLLQLTVRRKTVNRKPQILSLPSDVSDVMGLILMPIFYHSQHSSREAFDYRPSPFNKKLTRFYIENKLDYRVERANFVLVWKRRYPNQLSIDFETILFCVRTTKSNFTFQLFTILALTSFSGRRMT